MNVEGRKTMLNSPQEKQTQAPTEDGAISFSTLYEASIVQQEQQKLAQENLRLQREEIEQKYDYFFNDSQEAKIRSLLSLLWNIYSK